MPPSFLTQRKSQIRRIEEACEVESTTKTCMRDVDEGTDVILDLKGADSTVLLALLRKRLSCSSRESYVSEESADELIVNTENMVVYLISPQAALLPMVKRPDDSMIWDTYSILSAWDYHGHITTEDWPPYQGSAIDFLGQLKLGMYAVSCTH